MIILGIDPGTTLIGYALVKEGAAEPALIASGLLKFPKKDLVGLWSELGSIFKKWKPEELAIERVFFAKNAKTALAVAEARGAILLTATLAGLKIREYTPLEVKKAVTGDGRADKSQIKRMLTLTLPEAASIKGGDDACDAVALALTCCFDKKRRLDNY